MRYLVSLVYLFQLSGGLPFPGPGSPHTSGGGPTIPKLVNSVTLSTFTTGSGTGTTAAIDCSGTAPSGFGPANYIAILTTDFTAPHDATTDTISDSLNGTYTLHGPNSPTTAVPGASSTIFYIFNPTVSNSMTFSGSGLFNTIFVGCFSGVSPTSNPQSTVIGDCSGGGACTPGTLTPAENNDLIIAGAGYANTASMTVDSPFTIFADNNAQTGAFAYYVQTSGAGATNPTFHAPNAMTSSIGMVLKHN